MPTKVIPVKNSGQTIGSMLFHRPIDTPLVECDLNIKNHNIHGRFDSVQLVQSFYKCGFDQDQIDHIFRILIKEDIL